MTALAIIRFLQQLKDVTWGSPNDQDVLTYDAGTQKAVWATGGGGGGPPSGPAGGVLSGTYPDPGFAVDMATQAELDAAVALLVPLTRLLTAGAGLAGGGDLSADRTFSVNVDNASIEISADTLQIKAGGVTLAMLAFDPATQAELDAAIAALAGVYAPLTRLLTAGNGLSGGGDLSADRTFTVNVDGSTLEIVADALQVKDGGITTAKLAFTVSAFAQTYLDDADAATTRATLGVIASLFQNGGAQEISVAGLNGELADAQPVTVRKNTGADVGTRSRLNFIEGSNVTLTVSDDAGSDEVDITIAASGGGGTDLGYARPFAMGGY